jgi:hypothetical protein
MMRSRVGCYALTATLSLLLLAVVLELWRADPRVPLAYMPGDVPLVATLVKSIGETGWVLDNPRLGAPFGLNLRDFPFVDAFHFLALRALSVLVNEWGTLVNLYYVVSFPLTALASLYALRSFAVSTPTAVAVSLLFAFLPYHLHGERGMRHLFLTSYFAIPLVTTLLLRVASGRALFADAAPGATRGRRFGRRGITTSAIALLAASTRVYYAFFACFLLLVAGGLAWSRGHRRSARSAAVLIALVSAVTLAQMAPTALYSLRNGSNPAVANRSPGESEIFALKIAQLLLPIDGHRIPSLARLKDRYDLSAVLVNENGSASLGFIGSCGFLFLLLWAFYAGGRRHDDPLTSLAVLNLSAVLLGTMGGFGSLFALLVSPQLRAWTRISIYVAFFSLAAVALLLDAARRRWPRRLGGRGPFFVLLGLLVLAGVADQTSSELVPPYEDNQRTFRSDAEFVHRVEASLPQGAMVFQLPYVPFPENPPVHDMPDYDHLRGYLHSRALRWSYGAIKGRSADAWQRAVADQPAPELLRTLALAGFGGVYVNRWGYADGAQSLEQDLAALVGRPTAVSGDAKLAFFDLAAFARELRARYSADDWGELRDEALRRPLVFHWGGDCADLERGVGYDWRWCGRTGTLTILNPDPAARRARLAMTLSTTDFEPSNLFVEGGDVSEKLTVSTLGTDFSTPVTVPRAGLVLRFRSTAERPSLKRDPRELAFRVTDFQGDEIR